MKTRTIIPLSLVLALGSAAVGAGCSHHMAEAAGNAAAQPNPGAPFATPPVLPGTPDVATLVAKVQPVVVNITTVHELRAPRVDFEFPFDFGPFGFSRRP